MKKRDLKRNGNFVGFGTIVIELLISLECIDRRISGLYLGEKILFR